MKEPCEVTAGRIDNLNLPTDFSGGSNESIEQAFRVDGSILDGSGHYLRNSLYPLSGSLQASYGLGKLLTQKIG
jgi:hypothetical protein